MNPQVYRRRMDEIVQAVNDGFFKDAVRRTRLLVRDSNVSLTTIESQLKTALFQQHGPKVDKIWTSYQMAFKQKAA